MKDLKNSLLAFLVTILFAHVSLGQNTYLDIASERNLMSKSVSPKVEAIGSPYINETFESIKIKRYEDKVYSARFNAHNGEMEVKLSDDVVVALDPSKDFEVTFTKSNKMYRTFSYTSYSGTSKKGFLIVVKENDNYILLKEERIKFYDKVKAASSYQKDKPAKFRKEDDRYYLKLGDAIYTLSNKKKDILKAYPKHAKNIKAFLKDNKLSLKKEADMVTLAEYIASL